VARAKAAAALANHAQNFAGGLRLGLLLLQAGPQLRRIANRNDILKTIVLDRPVGDQHFEGIGMQQGKEACLRIPRRLRCAQNGKLGSGRWTRPFRYRVGRNRRIRREATDRETHHAFAGIDASPKLIDLLEELLQSFAVDALHRGLIETGL